MRQRFGRDPLPKMALHNWMCAFRDLASEPQLFVFRDNSPANVTKDPIGASTTRTSSKR